MSIVVLCNVLIANFITGNGFVFFTPETFGTFHQRFCPRKMSTFKRKILELVDDIGIILNDFQS